MPQEMNLQKLERKAWTSYFDDGLLDITVGLFVLAFGIGMTTQYTYLTVLSWMVIFFFAAAKKSITLPRVGLVKFHPEREERIKKENLFFVVFFSITAIVGLGFFIAHLIDIPLSVKSIVGELALVAYELIIAVGLCFVAYWKQINRFYAYGAFVLAIIVAGQFFTNFDVHPFFVTGAVFLAAGSVILITGLAVLVRFLRKYPKPEGEEYAK